MTAILSYRYCSPGLCAAGSGVPFAWAAADEVYGRSSRLREACEEAGKCYAALHPAAVLL